MRKTAYSQLTVAIDAEWHKPYNITISTTSEPKGVISLVSHKTGES